MFQLNLSVDTLNLINQAKYTERCLIMSNAHIEVLERIHFPQIIVKVFRRKQKSLQQVPKCQICEWRVSAGFVPLTVGAMT